MVGGAGVPGRWGGGLINHAALFHTCDGLAGCTDPEWLQGVFDTLVRVFNMVDIHTNVGKTVGMICCPCRMIRSQS